MVSLDNVRKPLKYELLDSKPGVWIRLLGADPDSTPFPNYTLTAEEADAIMVWSMNNRVGVRMSFDMWKFESQSDLTAFLLKWC